MGSDSQEVKRIRVGEVGPNSPDPYTQKEIVDYSAAQFNKYQIITLQADLCDCRALNSSLEEKRRELQCDAILYKTKYENIKSARANLFIEFGFIQGMTAFAGAILGFVPDDEFWRKLGWLLLGIGLILSVFKGLLTSLIVRFMPAWIYDESPRIAHLREKEK